MTGGRFTPPPNPPSVTYQPWNHVTVMTIVKGEEKEYKLTDIVTILKKQLDPTNRGFNQGTGEHTLVLQIRLDSITAWNLTGRVVALSISDYTDAAQAKENREQLAGLVDAGTTTHTPAVGYRYPSSLRQTVLRNDKYDRDVVIMTLSAGSTDTVCIHISLEYKFDGPVKPPITQLTEALLLKELAAGTSAAQASAQKIIGIDKVLKRLDVTAKNTNDLQKSGYLEKIIDGVKHTAMIVSAVAEEQDDAMLVKSFERLGF